MAKALKVLFIPVSTAKGIGEYMRSLIIAQAISRQWPETEVSFILNKSAPYASSCPFPHFLLDDTPTKCIPEVKQLISDFAPDVTLFDCSGRASQVRHAKACGSKVVFISQHKKKRNRGFSIGRLPYLDAHWITQFKFVDGDLTWLEKLKLKLFHAKPPLFIGPVFSPAAPDLPAELKHLAQQDYVLWAAGGGGHSCKGMPATEVFYHAAQALPDQQLQHVLLTGANYQSELQASPHVQLIKCLPNDQLIALMQRAKLVVSGGGDMMGQAIVLNKNIVAISVAGDQPTRVAKCLAQKLIYTAPLEPSAIVRQVKQALAHPLQHKYDLTPGLSFVLDYFKAVIAERNSGQ